MPFFLVLSLSQSSKWHCFQICQIHETDGNTLIFKQQINLFPCVTEKEMKWNETITVRTQPWTLDTNEEKSHGTYAVKVFGLSRLPFVQGLITVALTLQLIAQMIRKASFGPVREQSAWTRLSFWSLSALLEGSLQVTWMHLSSWFSRLHSGNLIFCSVCHL